MLRGFTYFTFLLLFPLVSFAAPQDYFEVVQKLYVAYYQRPADPGGLLYWSERLDQAGGSLEGIVEAFANSPESQELYGGREVEEIIKEMYLAAFNREPDPVGLEFYSSKVRSGEYSLMDVTLRILDGAVGSDKEVLEAKIKAAQLFTTAIDPELIHYSGSEDAQIARLWLREISEVPPLEEVERVVELIGRNDSQEGDREFLIYGIKEGVSDRVYREVCLVDPDSGESFEFYGGPVLGTWLFFAPDFIDESFNYRGYRARQLFFFPEEDGDPSTLEGGRIFGIDFKDPTFTLKQVSSLASACEWGCVYSDLWDWFAEVKAAGPDGRCGTYDDETFLVSSLMGPADQPVKLDGIEIIDVTYGGIVRPLDGFLVYDSREKSLKQCDKWLRSCKILLNRVDELTNLTSGTDVSHGGSSELAFFLVGNDLYGYDVIKKRLFLMKENLRPQIDLSKCVTYLPEGLYFVDSSGYSLVLVTKDGKVVSSARESEPIRLISGFTDNYLVYTTGNSEVKVLKRRELGRGMTVAKGVPLFFSPGGIGVEAEDRLCLWNEKTGELNCLKGANFAGLTLKEAGNFLNGDFFRYFLISQEEGGEVTFLKLNPVNYEELFPVEVYLRGGEFSTYMAFGKEERALLTVFHFDAGSFLPDEDVYLIKLDSEELIPVADDPEVLEEGLFTGG